jgi:hypothetical protein
VYLELHRILWIGALCDIPYFSYFKRNKALSIIMSMCLSPLITLENVTPLEAISPLYCLIILL